MKRISYSTNNAPGLLQKVLAMVVVAALVVLGLMFSVVLLVIVFVAAVIFWIFLWGKTRAIRKQMKQMQEAMRNFQAQSANRESGVFRGEGFKGEIIEGEVIRKGEPEDKAGHKSSN